MTSRIGRFIHRWAYTATLVVLLALIGISGAFVLVVALPDLEASNVPSPTAAAGATATPGLSVMSWVSIPANADCSACHTVEGGAIGVPTAPALGHPLQGWTNCTACHANDRLVATAPGHSGIHAQDCLLCHATSDLPPPLSRPHRDLQNQDCLTCHGVTAPLPADMSHRSQSVCWLCHRLPQIQPPLPAHPVAAGQRDCLRCHVAGGVGELPADHASRSVEECLLCHAKPETSSLGGPPIVALTRGYEVGAGD